MYFNYYSNISNISCTSMNQEHLSEWFQQIMNIPNIKINVIYALVLLFVQ